MFEKKNGQKVPSVTFKTRLDGNWKDVTSEDIFANKKVVVFALPGAFTPTCSSTHLPRYNDLWPNFKKLGVDQVVCLSVNDAFVMESWGKDQECENIFLLPDGNGEFSEKIGMLVDKSDIGFGKRSWRYSMVVNDGVIEEMFIEEDVPGDPFEVSDADTMLKYLDPNAKVEEGYTIFTKPGCPYCKQAKEALEKREIPFTELKGVRTQTLRSMGGSGTYPLIFANGHLIGGAEDLVNHLKN